MSAPSKQASEWVYDRVPVKTTRRLWRAGAAVLLLCGLVLPGGEARGEAEPEEVYESEPSDGEAEQVEAPNEEDEARLQARALAGEGLDLVAAGDYQAALGKLDAADRLVPAPTLKLEAARCLDRLGRMLEAAAKYREVIQFELVGDVPPVHREARSTAVAELAALQRQIPRLSIVLRTDATGMPEVRLDGAVLDAKERLREQRLDPGQHVVAATVGGLSASETVVIARGEQREVVLWLMRPAPPPPPAAPEATGSGWTTAGWIALGLGGAGLVAGGIAGAVVLARDDGLAERCPGNVCPPDAHDDARSFNTIRGLSSAGLIFGAVGVAAGVTFLLLAPAPSQPHAVSLSLEATGNGLGIRGSF